jgi:hypothetical protein
MVPNVGELGQSALMLTVSLENNCNNCAAEPSAIAKGMFHTPLEFVEAVHNNTHVPDAKLDVLVTKSSSAHPTAGHR